jgi:hypothetical protein
MYCAGNRLICPAEENPTLAVEESTPLPLVETVAPAAEATPPEATLVEGKWTTMGPYAPSSSHSPRILISCVLYLTGAQVEGTAIPEVVPVEGVVPKAEVNVGSASGPSETAAPEITEEVHDDALPETSMDVVVRSPEIQDTEPIRSTPM